MDQRKHILVTTFNDQGFELYGKNMIESFLEFWPHKQRLLVYVEDIDSAKLPASERVIYRDLLASSKDLVDFKIKHKDNRKANGYWPEKSNYKNFLYDAVRFSHKVFSLYHAANNLPDNEDTMTWMDGDTVTHSPVPEDFLDQLIEPNTGITYLGRLPQQYTECGWVSYNMRDPLMPAFWQRFADYYRHDLIFDLTEWHDSHVFDVVRLELEHKGMINHNLTPTYFGHPFINCVLGDYMDHLKGPRKNKGRSNISERQINNKSIGWWKK